MNMLTGYLPNLFKDRFRPELGRNDSDNLLDASILRLVNVAMHAWRKHLPFEGRLGSNPLQH